MTNLIPEGMEEVPLENGGLPFPPSPNEEIIHSALFMVRILDGGSDGDIYLLQFLTPFKTTTVKLTAEAAKALSDQIRPSGIVLADAMDLKALKNG